MAKNTAYDWIVFDLGGVLFELHHDRFQKQIAELSKLPFDAYSKKYRGQLLHSNASLSELIVNGFIPLFENSLT